MVIISIVGNSLLFLLKLWIGIQTSSLALQADAWHTISDTLSSLVVLAGLYIARRPPDHEHPFGHGRYELLTTLLVGAMLIWVAGTFFYKGIELLAAGTAAHFGKAAIIVTILSIVIKELMARITFWGSKRSGNSALYADGWHHRSDALSSIVVLVGIFFGYYFWWIDGVLSLLIAVMIAYVAFQTIRQAASTLVGEAPSENLRLAITTLIAHLNLPYDLQPHNLRLHNYIQNQELTLSICLPDDLAVREAYAITSSIERLLLQELNLNATIHIKPNSTQIATETKAL